MDKKLANDEDLIFLTDLFGCEDGGLNYIKLCMFIDAMKEKAKNGDASANELVQVLRKFTKLVKIAIR